MNAAFACAHFNAPGIGGPGDSDDDFLDLVAEYMEAGMSQDDAEIAAMCKIEEDREMRLLDAGEDAYEDRMDREFGE